MPSVYAPARVHVRRRLGRHRHRVGPLQQRLLGLPQFLWAIREPNERMRRCTEVASASSLATPMRPALRSFSFKLGYPQGSPCRSPTQTPPPLAPSCRYLPASG
eukprot:3410248-Alexandrium_andersonii.AAC.1